MSTRTLQQIKEDFSARLQSREVMPSFIERTNDYIEFCNMVGQAFAPYMLQFETLGDIWNSATLLAEYLSKKGLYLSGSEDLSALREIAENTIAIFRCRGTLLQKKELARLLNVDFETDIEHDILDMTEVGWNLRNSSPCYKGIDSNKYNLCFLRLDEMYAIFSNNRSTKTDEEILAILQKKFFPLHINNVWLVNNDIYSLTSKTMNAFNDNVFYNDGNAIIKIRIGFKNLSLEGGETESYLLQFGDPNKFYIKYKNTGKLVIGYLSESEVEIDFNFVSNKEYYLDCLLSTEGITNNSYQAVFYINGYKIFDTSVNWTAPENIDWFAIGDGNGVSSVLMDLFYVSLYNRRQSKLVYDFTNIDSVIPVKNKNYSNNDLSLLI